MRDNDFLIIDLSHEISPGMPVYPGTPQPGLEKLYLRQVVGYNEDILRMSTHTGTHLDSPAHILAAGNTVDRLPPGQFLGRGRVADCSQSGGTIELKHLAKELRGLKYVDYLLIHTGHSASWTEESYCRDYPVLTAEAAQYISMTVQKGLGIDTVSVDAVGAPGLPVHNLLLQKGLVIVENLTNLDKLLAKEFLFACFPLKIKGGEASPVRAAAIVTA